MKSKNLLVLFGSIGAICQANANILVNPGFETGNMSGWTTSSFTATNNDSHTGTWSAINFGNFTLTQGFTPIAATDITEVSVWAKQPDFSTFFFAIDFNYTDSSSEEYYGTGGTATEWTKYDFTSNLNLSKTLSSITVYGNSSGTTFYDDFVLNANPVPEPASFAVLGLGAFALLRRRKK